MPSNQVCCPLIAQPQLIALFDAGYESAQKSVAAASNEKDRATAQVEVAAFTNLARAVGVAL